VENHAEQTTVLPSAWSRRRFLQAGAATAVGAAALAACSTKDNPTARIGTVPSTTALPAADVTDVTLMRTATSLEHLLVSVYDTVAEKNLLSGSQAAIAAKMRDQHQDNAATFADLTTEAGGEVYDCPNDRMTRIYIEPAMQYILGSKQAAAALGIAEPDTELPPSPDPTGDTLVLLNALEVITAATHQAYVAMLNSIELRAAGMQVGVGSSRRGALWGALITPDALVDDAVLANLPTVATTAPPTTAPDATATTVSGEAEAAGPAPVVHAVSASFGQLGPALIELGAADENGIRKKVNIETPFLNSLAYEYQTCDA
jgi:hypothetical protein